MKQVVTLSVLLGLALIGSYVTWTADDPVASSSGVAVYAAGSEIQRVEWHSEKLDVLLEKRRDNHGDFIWMTTTERFEVRVQDPSPVAERVEGAVTDADEGTEVDEAPEAAEVASEPATRIEQTVRTYVGNDVADELWSNLSPLMALRELGRADAVNLEALGLSEPSATLTVHRASGPLTLQIGGETYGGRDRYALYDGRVLLVDDVVLRPLIYAGARLGERSLHPLSEKDVQRIEVADAQGRSTTLVHQNASDPTKAYWARSDSTDAADVAAGSWVGKLLRLRLMKHVDASELDGELAPVFRFTVQGRDGAWTTEVLSLEQDDNTLYYARSDYNRGLVELTQSLAAEAVADLQAALPR